MGAERLSARSGHSANRKTTGTTQQAREMPIPESTLSGWSHHQAGTAFKQAHVPIREALAAYNWPSDVKYEVFLQGSYKNDTNLGGDSDVDVVVRLTRSRFLSSGSLTETLA